MRHDKRVPKMRELSPRDSKRGRGARAETLARRQQRSMKRKGMR